MKKHYLHITSLQCN